MRRLRYCNYGVGAAERWVETISPAGGKAVEIPDGTLIVLHDDAVAAITREQKSNNEVGAAAERSRLREKVEAMLEIVREESADLPVVSSAERALNRVLALLAEPGEERT